MHLLFSLLKWLTLTFARLHTCKASLSSFLYCFESVTRLVEKYTNQQLKVHLKVPSKCLYVSLRPDGQAQ